MIDLQERSGKKELLDSDNIPFEDIRQNLAELNRINKWLGGHAITVAGLKKLVTETQREITICEIGCGGGDNLAALHSWCHTNQIKARFIGIDLKEECIQFARQQYPDLAVTWITSPYESAALAQNPDFIFSSLFCHHFTNEQLVFMLQWMQSHSQQGFFINDLQRTPFAYYSIKWLTYLFSRSYLVKNDAPLSVARGLVKREWHELLARAGIKGANVEWKWAFRYLITYKTK